MFRDFVYITYDYTVRAQDGYFIFRWWRSYVPKDVSEGELNLKSNRTLLMTIIFHRSFPLGHAPIGPAKWLRAAHIQQIGFVRHAGKDVWSGTIAAYTDRCG